ncbi:MAG TPA: hypothetical protein VHQ39_05040, partial [Dongiaceae bacterium]|nr:hypothetical protein [Dongiaceae bacterium]
DYGKEQGNERAAATGKVIAGMCHFATGRFENARADLDEAQAILSGGNHGTETNEGRALVYLALTLHILGKSGEANRLMAVALELARHRRGADLAVTLGNSLYLFYMQSNVEQTRRICLELEHLSEEKGLIMWYHQARFFLGWADALEGARSGLEAMEASMNRFRSAHEVVEQSFFYGVLAERYLAAGNAKRALDNVERGLKLAERLGERFFEAPLLRLKAKCLTGASNSNNAKAIAELSDQAEKLVRQQGAAAWV